MLLSRILPDAARLNPSNYAIKSTSEIITYERLWHRVRCVASGLQSLSIEPGDRIILLGNPSPYLTISECAAMAIGAIPIGIFPELAPREMKQIVQDAAPAAVVYDPLLTNVSEIISLFDVKHTIACHSGHTFHSIEHYIATYPPLTQSYEADPDDVALIIYTGGTTGRSKGVMHSHRAIRQWAFMDPTKGGGHIPTKKAIVLNQAHLTGQFILWTTLFEGGCLIFADSYPLHRLKRS